MHAWRGHDFGTPDVLVWEEVADPSLSKGQVRIKIVASAVNFMDALYTAGKYQVKPTPPFTPGSEVAGVVVESREPTLPEGTRVVATLDAGGHATHAVAGVRAISVLPDAMPFTDAAALTITYQTGHFALHRRAGIKAGDHVLIHAGAGGVGSAAIQLAKAAGATVFATAGGPEKVALCRTLGADVAIDYKSEDFVSIVRRHTGGRGADIIFDPIGGDVFDRSTKCVAWEGRIVVIGFASGRFPEVRANHLLVKNYAVLGLYWGAYNLVNPEAVRLVQQDLYALYQRGAIKPLISSVRPMSEARAAIADVASGATTGKVLLSPES